MRMMSLIGSTLLSVAVVAGPSVATAQTGGGLGSLLGGGVPTLRGVGAGNAAGMLSYCIKNKLLGSSATAAGGSSSLLGRLTGAATPTPIPSATPTPATQSAAQGVLGQLLGRREVTASPGYAAGQAGQLQLGQGKVLPVGGLQDQVKSRLYSAVLSRARSFM